MFPVGEKAVESHKFHDVSIFIFKKLRFSNIQRGADLGHSRLVHYNIQQ